MSEVVGKHKRGRPVGSTMPVEQKRQRKDYRLSPMTLAQIEQGRMMGEQKETAFIEAAIAHYVAFLAGDYVARAEVQELQARISELEDEVRALKSSRQVVKLQSGTPAATRRAASSVTYQIVVRHALGACPALPDGFHYEDTKTSVYRHPVHQVYTAPCTISEARRELDRLKAVEGIIELWLTKNGYTMERERWVRIGDSWEKN